MFTIPAALCVAGVLFGTVDWSDSFVGGCFTIINVDRHVVCPHTTGDPAKIRASLKKLIGTKPIICFGPTIGGRMPRLQGDCYFEIRTNEYASIKEMYQN